MKKLLVIILLAAAVIYAQENSKGNVSLIFNGEKIDLPINSVSVTKGNHIIVRITADYQDSTKKQDVQIDIGLKELSQNNPELLEGTSFNISTQNSIESTGKDLSINFGESSKEAAYYKSYKKGEQIIWEVNSVSMRVNVTQIDFTNGNLILNGEFSGTFRSTLAKDKEISEIKNGKFKIII